MKIACIAVYQADLPLVDGDYCWADGKSVSVYDSTVVAVTTDSGITGYGEVVPLGPNYLASYAAGVRAGIKELGPKLLGQDPTQLSVLNAYMDYHLKGHPYVKSGLDMACWDILGKVSGLPVNTLLGGNFNTAGVNLYRAIGQDTPQKMADMITKYRGEGYKRFQLKLGGDPNIDIERIKACRAVMAAEDVLVGDSNTGWSTHQALRLVHAVKDVDVYIEQPCPSYQECCVVRNHTNLPFVLDEVVDDINSLLDAVKDGSADVVNIKISKFGGLTKAKQAVDLCAKVGLAMTIEDTWGGDITTAAILHLAHIAPEKLQFTVTDFNSYNRVRTGTISGAEKAGGLMGLPIGPGLGVVPDWEVLGKPLFTIN
jgi:L-alanine-DL-glutamate epimerase-like enolase superfamily enzyme